MSRVRCAISSWVERPQREYVSVTSAISVVTTPRRASSVARYCARADSFSRRKRPHTSSSQPRRSRPGSRRPPDRIRAGADGGPTSDSAIARRGRRSDDDGKSSARDDAKRARGLQHALGGDAQIEVLLQRRATSFVSVSSLNRSNHCTSASDPAPRSAAFPPAAKRRRDGDSRPVIVRDRPCTPQLERRRARRSTANASWQHLRRANRDDRGRPRVRSGDGRAAG